MLVLGRKVGEEVHLGKDVVLKIISISQGVVKVGIDAPKELLILRGELKRKIEAKNREANIKVALKEIKDLSKLLKK
jgi:carbon storage regulator